MLLKRLTFFFKRNPLALLISFSVSLFGKDYSLNDCIQTALNQKKTVLSADLDVLSAEKGVVASFSGILPSIQAVSGLSQNRFPERETIGLNFDSFSIDTNQFSSINNFSAGLSLNQLIYDGGRSKNQIQQQARTNLDIALFNQRNFEII